jgi:hypothetical protein
MSGDLSAANQKLWQRVAIAALVVTAIIAFSLALLAIGNVSLLVYEASRFGFAAIIFGRLAYVIGKAWYQSTGARRVSTADAPRAYAVPRRFGLATLFIITLAFGLLSAVMQWAHFPPIAVGLVLAFVALVGVLQVIFDQSPRHASMIAGSLWFSISAMGLWIVADPNTTSFALSTVAFYAACWALLGAGIGYCTGTFVGGVFLITELVAGFLWRRPQPAARQEPEISGAAPTMIEKPIVESARDPNYPYYARVNSPHRSSKL